ncbi:alpha/beta hydrolase [Paraburkholderia sediminicola]|uniref:alpha/beta hydrolase n=1 Tax=Paraburkholderia sediminicola TaxID=458836 RepID=UPI0038BC1C8F
MSLPELRRYPPGTDFIGFGDRSPAVAPEVVFVRAGDGVSSRSVLYASGKEKTVVCLMHPRADMTRHYAVPDIVGNGFAFYIQQGRFPGDDISAATIHEPLVADIAAGMTFLRSRGFEHIILLGNSGAAPLYALYQAQASTAAPERLTDTAAGDPYDLGRFDMPLADGFIFLGAHLGPGITMQGHIDPSVIDESDPLSCDPELDMYNVKNGFKAPPGESRYSADFLAQYKTAQRIRGSRIDAIAWSMIHAQRHAEVRIESPTFDKLEYNDQAFIMRRAAAAPLMQIYRLDADPASVDLSLRPSDRSYGSLMSVRPDLANYSLAGGKIFNPKVWLSSWSERYSRARLLNCLPKITVPSLILTYTGDNAIGPDVAELVYRESLAADKEFAAVVGDHFGFPVPSKPNEGGREAALKVMVDWIRKRFPSAQQGIS